MSVNICVLCQLAVEYFNRGSVRLTLAVTENGIYLRRGKHEKRFSRSNSVEH